MKSPLNRVVLVLLFLFAALAAIGFAQEKRAPKMLTLTAKEAAAAEFRAGLEATWQWASLSARDHMKKALELDPSFGLARAYLARFERRNVAEETERALADAARASAPEVLFTLGLRENMAGRAGRIGPLLALAMDMVPDDPYVAMEHAWVLPPKDRIEALRKITVTYPDFAPGHATLAYFLTYAYSGISDADMSEAWQHAQDALRAGPQIPNAQLAAAHVLQRMGKLEEAAPYLNRAMSMQPVSGYAYELAAEIAATKGQYAEARRLLSLAIQNDGFATNIPNYERAMGLAFMREGKTKEAIATLEASAQKAAANGFKAASSANHVFCGLMLAAMGDRSAPMHFEEARKLNGAAGMTHNEVFIHALLGDAASARAAMERYAAQSVNITPADATMGRTKMLHAMTGMILLAEKKPKEAMEELKLAEDNPWGIYGLADAYKALGMKKEMKAQRALFLSRPEPGLSASSLLPIALVKWRS